jgi:hypothetical protein
MNTRIRLTRRKLALSITGVLFAGAFAATPLFAQAGVGVPNWTVPPYHRAAASGELVTMSDLTPGVGFVGVTPCRLVDTRQAGFPAGYGPPALSGGAPRNFDLNSDPQCPGIPSAVEAYSLNITVTNTQGPGFILIYPQGGTQPTVSTVNYVGGQTIANAAIVPAGTGGGVTVIAGVSGTDLVIDINGYFTGEYNPGVRLFAQISGVGGAVQGRNIATLAGAYGVEGSISTTTSANSSAGVRGINDGTGATGIGVWGSHAASGWGVFGEAPTGFGVVGRVATDINNRAGVIGQTGFVTPAGSYSTAGVRGEGRAGVLGISGNFLGGGEGVAGSLVDGFGAEIRYGALATSFGINPSGGAAPWAVFGGGDIGATGTKHFLDPHPTDATKEIAYVSLEGPEAGTYFRGRAKFQNGMARIPVPEHFRFVTDPEGLTVQITPIGAMASFAVLKMDLNEIVVQASRNVEFSYLVQGVRATFKDVSPIRSSGDFMPRSANAKIPAWLSPAQKRLLIQNGTYREDGTVNTETARQLGWDRVWEQRSRPASQPAPQAVTP